MEPEWLKSLRKGADEARRKFGQPASGEPVSESHTPAPLPSDAQADGIGYEAVSPAGTGEPPVDEGVDLLNSLGGPLEEVGGFSANLDLVDDTSGDQEPIIREISDPTDGDLQLKEDALLEDLGMDPKKIKKTLSPAPDVIPPADVPSSKDIGASVVSPAPEPARTPEITPPSGIDYVAENSRLTRELAEARRRAERIEAENAVLITSNNRISGLEASLEDARRSSVSNERAYKSADAARQEREDILKNIPMTLYDILDGVKKDGKFAIAITDRSQALDLIAKYVRTSPLSIMMTSTSDARIFSERLYEEFWTLLKSEYLQQDSTAIKARIYSNLAKKLPIISEIVRDVVSGEDYQPNPTSYDILVDLLTDNQKFKDFANEVTREVGGVDYNTLAQMLARDYRVLFELHESQKAGTDNRASGERDDTLSDISKLRAIFNVVEGVRADTRYNRADADGEIDLVANYIGREASLAANTGSRREKRLANKETARRIISNGLFELVNGIYDRAKSGTATKTGVSPEPHADAITADAFKIYNVLVGVATDAGYVNDDKTLIDLIADYWMSSDNVTGQEEKRSEYLGKAENVLRAYRLKLVELRAKIELYGESLLEESATEVSDRKTLLEIITQEGFGDAVATGDDVTNNDELLEIVKQYFTQKNILIIDDDQDEDEAYTQTARGFISKYAGDLERVKAAYKRLTERVSELETSSADERRSADPSAERVEQIAVNVIAGMACRYAGITYDESRTASDNISMSLISLMGKLADANGEKGTEKVRADGLQAKVDALPVEVLEMLMDYAEIPYTSGGNLADYKRAIKDELKIKYEQGKEDGAAELADHVNPGSTGNPIDRVVAYGRMQILKAIRKVFGIRDLEDTGQDLDEMLEDKVRAAQRDAVSDTFGEGLDAIRQEIRDGTLTSDDLDKISNMEYKAIVAEIINRNPTGFTPQNIRDLTDTLNLLEYGKGLEREGKHSEAAMYFEGGIVWANRNPVFYELKRKAAFDAGIAYLNDALPKLYNTSDNLTHAIRTLESATEEQGEISNKVFAERLATLAAAYKIAARRGKDPTLLERSEECKEKAIKFDPKATIKVLERYKELPMYKRILNWKIF